MEFRVWVEGNYPINEDWRKMLRGAVSTANYLNEKLSLLSFGTLTVLGAAIGAKAGWHNEQVLLAQLQNAIHYGISGLAAGGVIAGVTHNLIDRIIQKLEQIASTGNVNREKIFGAIKSAAIEK